MTTAPSTAPPVLPTWLSEPPLCCWLERRTEDHMPESDAPKSERAELGLDNAAIRLCSSVLFFGTVEERDARGEKAMEHWNDEKPWDYIDCGVHVFLHAPTRLSARTFPKIIPPALFKDVTASLKKTEAGSGLERAERRRLWTKAHNELYNLLTTEQWASLKIAYKAERSAATEWRRRGRGWSGINSWARAEANAAEVRVKEAYDSAMVLSDLHDATLPHDHLQEEELDEKQPLPPAGRSPFYFYVERRVAGSRLGSKVDPQGWHNAQLVLRCGDSVPEGALPLIPDEHVPKIHTGEVVFLFPDTFSPMKWPALLPPTFSTVQSPNQRSKLDAQSRIVLQKSLTEEEWKQLTSEAWFDYLCFYELRRRYQVRGGTDVYAECKATVERYNKRREECLVLLDLEDSTPVMDEKSAYAAEGDVYSVSSSTSIATTSCGMSGGPTAADLLVRLKQCFSPLSSVTLIPPSTPPLTV